MDDAGDLFERTGRLELPAFPELGTGSVFTISIETNVDTMEVPHRPPCDIST